MKQYDDLKALVRTHDQQAAELARVKAAAAAEIDAARADADAARAAVEAASEELTKLRDEVGALRERRARERKSVAAAESSKAAAASAELDAALESAARREAARSAAELAIFKEAADADVHDAVEAVRAEHAAAEARWLAEADAMRRSAALRSERHAARLRDVILSEEACRARAGAMEPRLRGQALCSLSLCVRAARSERRDAMREVSVRALLTEVAGLERLLAISEEGRQASSSDLSLNLPLSLPPISP